jgi:hypothetical protein
MVLLMVQSGKVSVQELVVLLEVRVAAALMLEAWLGVAAVHE